MELKNEIPLPRHVVWLILLISGCATSKQISGPNGEVLHSIDCSGYYNNIGTCLEKAGKICGSRGYDILGSRGYDILIGGTGNQGTAISSGQFGLFAAPMISREIIIRCKNTEFIQDKTENIPTTQYTN